MREASNNVKKKTSFERTLLIKNIGDKAKNCPFLLDKKKSQHAFIGFVYKFWEVGVLRGHSQTTESNKRHIFFSYY